MDTKEFEAVFRVASPALQLALLLAHEAGLRKAAIVNFTASNCNFERNEITGRTKGYASYTVPMTHRLRQRLQWDCSQVNDANETLLALHNRGRKRMHINTLNSMLVRAKRKAQITRQWGLHDLRRTAARNLYAKTHDLRKVQRLLGHAGLAQSLWYLGNLGIDIEPEDIDELLNQGKEQIA